MKLEALVKQYVERARREPSFAAAANVLDDLARAAAVPFRGGVSPAPVPIATDSLETSIVLSRASLVPSARVPLVMPSAVEIVGVLPIVRSTFAAAEAGLPDPTTDDVQVSLDLNNQRYLTQAGSTSAGSTPAQFVTMSGLASNNRLLGLRLDNARPEVGFTWRWKTNAAAAPAPWRSAIVTCVLFVNYLDGGR